MCVRLSLRIDKKLYEKMVKIQKLKKVNTMNKTIIAILSEYEYSEDDGSLHPATIEDDVVDLLAILNS